MADTYALTGSITAQPDLKSVKTATSGALTTFKSDAAKMRHIGTITSGTGDDKADDVYEAEISIAASATEAIDLTGTTYFNPHGVALAWAKLKGIFIKTATANPDTVTVGGGGTPVIATCEPIPPSGSMLRQFPIQSTAPAVAAGATDLLNIVNDDAGAAAIVYVCLWGEKA